MDAQKSSKFLDVVRFHDGIFYYLCLQKRIIMDKEQLKRDIIFSFLKMSSYSDVAALVTAIDPNLASLVRNILSQCVDIAENHPDCNKECGADEAYKIITDAIMT